MTPSTDQKIAQKYTASTVEKKNINKTSLQEELGWAPEPKRPMLCFPVGMSDALGGETLKEILPGLLSMDIEILILGKGSSAYGKLFTELAKEHSHRIAIIPNEETAIRKMYAASDIAVFLKDPSKTTELQKALSYGVVPVSPETSALKNYNPVQESGNAFLFSETSYWLCFAAVVRALETLRFPFDWRTIQKHCMGSVE